MPAEGSGSIRPKKCLLLSNGSVINVTVANDADDTTEEGDGTLDAEVV
jgi:hypothetical protein